MQITAIITLKWQDYKIPTTTPSTSILIVKKQLLLSKNSKGIYNIPKKIKSKTIAIPGTVNDGA